MPEYVEEEFKKARRALADADRLRDAGGSAEAIVNRLYYACFHGGQAVLYDQGYNPTSHGAVVRLFGREIVHDGDASPDDGRLLNELRNLRTEADYGYEELDVDIRNLRNTVGDFLESMETILE